jgi:hypothetical protein
MKSWGFGIDKSGIPRGQKGSVNGVAELDNTGKVPASQLPSSIVGAVKYQGTWDANANNPALASGVGTQGHYYVVSVNGNTNLDGISDWVVGDWAIYNGTVWEKVDNTCLVTSVFHTLVWSMAEGAPVVAGTYKAPTIVIPFAGTITKAYAYARTGPAGADLIFDINKNGTSIWNVTPANRVKVADAANYGTQASFDTTAVAEGDLMDIDVDQIGSGTAGQDITVQLKITVD